MFINSNDMSVCVVIQMIKSIKQEVNFITNRTYIYLHKHSKNNANEPRSSRGHLFISDAASLNTKEILNELRFFMCFITNR